MLLCRVAEIVQPGDRGLERFGAEYESEWIVCLLLVQRVHEKRKLSS